MWQLRPAPLGISKLRFLQRDRCRQARAGGQMRWYTDGAKTWEILYKYTDSGKCPSRKLAKPSGQFEKTKKLIFTPGLKQVVRFLQG